MDTFPLQLHHFYLNIHAAREVQVHKRVNRFWGGAYDINQAFVGAEFVLFLRGFVDKRRTVDTVFVDFCRQRYRTDYFYVVALCGINDNLGRSINNLVIVCFNFDADFWSCLLCFLFFFGLCSHSKINEQ